MSDDFSKYANMKDAGSSPEDVYRESVRSGVDPITRIRLVRAVYGLSLGQAKEVVVKAEGEAGSLDQHQSKIADVLSRWERTEVADGKPIRERVPSGDRAADVIEN